MKKKGNLPDDIPPNWLGMLEFTNNKFSIREFARGNWSIWCVAVLLRLELLIMGICHITRAVNRTYLTSRKYKWRKIRRRFPRSPTTKSQTTYHLVTSILPLILPPKSCYSRSHACSHVKWMEAYWPINSFRVLFK
jgi:hypothetical protein